MTPRATRDPYERFETVAVEQNARSDGAVVRRRRREPEPVKLRGPVVLDLRLALWPEPGAIRELFREAQRMAR